MNQILQTNNQNIKKKSNNKYNGNNKPDIQRIIIFSSIAILFFALLIIGAYSYRIYKSNKKEDKTIGKPEITLEQVENQVKIIANADAGINKIIYTWNDDEPTEIEKNGITNLEEALEIPEGQNILKVNIVDQNGEEAKTEQEFYVEEDTEKPKLEIDEKILKEQGKVKITATDENNSIRLITYKWNDEQETTIQATEEGQTVLETTIDTIKRGKNTLKITAVNGINKEKSIEKILIGVNEPKIDVVKEGNKLIMKMTHDMGFEKIVFTINGQEYVYDENYADYNAEKKEVSFTFNLVEGENTVIIHAVSTEKTEKTYRGKCNYSAQ